MTPRQLCFLKEWGPLIGGALGLVSSAGLVLFLAFGFSLTTPARLLAQLEARVSELEGRIGHHARDMEAMLRFLCYLDHDKAQLAGIRDCPQANNLPGR